MASTHDIADAYTSTSSEEDQEQEQEEEVEEASKDCKDTILSTCPPRGRVFLDPRSQWVQDWNRVFLLVCATGLFIDPLFFYTLSISDSCMCVFVDGWFAVTITVLRCVTDSLHVWNMWLQFKMSWWWRSRHHDDGGVARSVAARVITNAKKGFFFDLFVILPIPQV
ncbi:hypothetical protein HanOQP8_Chr03g0109911 [Helianthus annuus]|nr:hypothetical protein HanOQP8_Chr03g0109911 [Helianthus annuus]